MPSLLVGASSSFVGEGEVGGPGIQTVVYNSTGSLAFNGTAAYARLKNVIASGSIAFEGAAGVTYVGVREVTRDSSGSISFTGTSSYSKQKSLIAAGSIVFGGSASISKIKNLQASGSISFSGTATISIYREGASIWNKDINTAFASINDGSSVWEASSVGGGTIQGGESVWK